MLFIHLAHVIIFRICLLRVLLLVLHHILEKSSWPVASVAFSSVLFVFYINNFLTWCFVHYIDVNIFTDSVFLTTPYLLHKKPVYSYSLSNVFQPRSTQWSSYCRRMMTPLTRSSWGVWWKALRWMMCMDQWVRYWRDSTSGHTLKDRGKTTSVPSWSRVGQ